MLCNVRWAGKLYFCIPELWCRFDSACSAWCCGFCKNCHGYGSFDYGCYTDDQKPDPACFSGRQQSGWCSGIGCFCPLSDDYGSFIPNSSYSARIQKCPAGPGNCNLVFDVRDCGTGCPYLDVQILNWVYWRGCLVFIRACIMAWCNALRIPALFLLQK